MHIYDVFLLYLGIHENGWVLRAESPLVDIVSRKSNKHESSPDFFPGICCKYVYMRLYTHPIPKCPEQYPVCTVISFFQITLCPASCQALYCTLNPKI